MRSCRGADVIVVGAGIIGASVAFHLAERGVDTLVIDREGPAAGSTARSGALIRAHYPSALDADLAWESITDYFEPWGERVGGGCGFTRTGFALLASEQEAGALERNVAMLREEVGVDTGLLSPKGLGDIDPTLEVGDITLAAYEPRGGYADPGATVWGFLSAAQRLGARFERRRALALTEDDGQIRGVETEEGHLEARAVVVAAGAWSVALAASAGLELPIRPARVQVALFERPHSLTTHLTLIDTVSEAYCRPTTDRCTLVGMRTSELEWLQSPDECDPRAEAGFVERASRRVAHRIPALKDGPYRSGWAGVVDMTPDGQPILGPEGPEGLYLSAGWSGKGFKKAPAVGAELARWVEEGSPGRKELSSSYVLKRFEQEGASIPEWGEYGSRSPH